MQEKQRKKDFDQPSAPNELSTKCDAYRYFIHQGSWCVLLFSLLELYETSARICHPQSNGKLERFHSTLKTEHVRKTPYFGYEDAKEKMAQWIDFYNNGRLHGALLYLTPEDYFAGRKACRTKGKTSYCRYKQKSLLAATAALLIHLISFPKKVQVHFGQDKRRV